MAPAIVRSSAVSAPSYPQSDLRLRDNAAQSEPLSLADFHTPSLPAYPQSAVRERQPAPADDWPLTPSNTLARRDPAPPVNTNFNPMAGARPPESFNNKGYFALFAILGAVMVIGAIWFFFWAENGGFRWRQGDWDDYKSTVLRRKDENGNTLSNATPRTNLGQKSVAGTFDYERDYEKRDPEMAEINEDRPRRHHKHKRSHRPHGEREHSDEDVRAYRSEKSAKVGGLNRQFEGSHYDFTNSDYSYSAYSASNPDETISNDSRTRLHEPTPPPPPPAEPAKKKGFLEKKKEQRNVKKAEKKVEKDQKKVEKNARKEDKKGKGKAEKSTPPRTSQPTRVRPAQRRPSLSTIDAASTVADSADRSRGTNESSYYDNYRPEQPAFARSYGNRASPPRRSPRASPRTSPRHTPAPSEPRQSSPLKREFMPRPPGTFDAQSEAGSSDTGTKIYQHHIPGASRSAGTPSRSNGYRRGGASRRDSLSDSD